MNTPKTIKLYDTIPYETTFTANVLSCEECKQHNAEDGQAMAGQILSSTVRSQYKTYKLILDQTLFFPEEGGQTPDKGTINGIEVIDVQINNDIVEHYLTVPIQAAQSQTNTTTADSATQQDNAHLPISPTPLSPVPSTGIIAFRICSSIRRSIFFRGL